MDNAFYRLPIRPPTDLARRPASYGMTWWYARIVPSRSIVRHRRTPERGSLREPRNAMFPPRFYYVLIIYEITI